MSVYPIGGSAVAIPLSVNYLGQFVPGVTTTEYFYGVVAYDTTSAAIAQSAFVSAFGPLVLDGDHAINISWSPVLGAHHYNVFKNIGSIPAINSSNLFYQASFTETAILDVGYPAATRNSFLNPGVRTIGSGVGSVNGISGDVILAAGNNIVITNYQPDGQSISIMAVPSGTNGMVQFNSAGLFGASPNFIFNNLVGQVQVESISAQEYLVNGVPFVEFTPGAAALENIATINGLPPAAGGNPVNLKGSVPTSANLPTTGNAVGDAYITVDTGHLWVWDGTQWLDQGPATQDIISGTCITVVATGTGNQFSVNAQIACIQTPWVGDVNAAAFALRDVKEISGWNVAPGGLLITGGAGNLQLANGDITFTFEPTGTQLIFGTGESFQIGWLEAASGSTTLWFDPVQGFLGLGAVITGPPAYMIDAQGDCNITGTYRVNGVPLALGQSQSPWVVNQDAANFHLSNLATLEIVGVGIFPGVYKANAMYLNAGGGLSSIVVTGSTPTTAGAFEISSSTSDGSTVTDVIRINPAPAYRVGVLNDSPNYTLDVNGDINTTGVFRVNGVPFAGAAQTPWTSNQDAANFNLTHLSALAVGYGPPSIDSTNPVYVAANGSGYAGISVVNFNNVGSASLQLTGFSGPQVNLGSGGSISTFPAQAFLAVAGNYPLVFFINSAERARITGSGLVGINTASPSNNLTVNGAIEARGPGFNLAPNALMLSYGGGLAEITSVGGSSTIKGGFNFAGSTSNGSTGQDYMRIDPNSGFVGIANDGPTYQLDVGGDCNIATGHAYRIGGVAIAMSNQTPWTSNIDGGNFNLSNVAKIGIGTTNPIDALHVASGGIRITNTFLAGNVASTFGLDYTNNTSRLISWGLDATTFGGFSFIQIHADGTGASQAMVITPSGAVGIGTANPSSMFHVASPANTTLTVESTAATAPNYSTLVLKTVPYSWDLLTAAYDKAGSYNAGDFAIEQTGVMTRLRIDRNGLVGIGLAAGVFPQTSLDVGGPIRVQAPSTPVPTTGAGVEILYNGTNGVIQTWDRSGGISLPTYIFGSVVAINSTTGGNVGIGTSNPAAPFHVHLGTNLNIVFQTISGVSVITSINDANSAYEPIGFYNSYTAFEGNVGIGLSIATTPSYSLQLQSDSAAKPTTNTWTIPSDIRTKRNVQSFDGDMEVIKKLEPIVSEYNGLGQTPEGQRVVSFDAAKLREIVPYAVTSVKGKLHPDDTEETDILGVNTHEIFYHMLKAIQYLDAQVTTLRNKS
jgi:hypothetical protein